jgi:putative IMPACT (imprinted ancient) family translation regulator
MWADEQFKHFLFEYLSAVPSLLDVLGRGHTKETGNCYATAISAKIGRFQAGNWFPD